MKIFTNPELTEEITIPVYDYISIGESDDKIIIKKSELLSMILSLKQEINQKNYEGENSDSYIYSSFEDFLDKYDFNVPVYKEKHGNNYIGKPFYPTEITLAHQAFMAGRQS